jgi:S-DNA-T family DNA segregation ATPase FtsK/SpoIIIE
VGIHAIIATQRPEVRIVDGLIQAQFPSRVAFSVALARDSVIILGVGGAQKLLGKGDMLFKDTSNPHPVRVQGLYVQDREIDRIAKYWRDHPTGPPDRMIIQ